MNSAIFRTSLAALLLVAAARMAALVQDGHGVAPLLSAVILAYLSVVVFAYALAAAWHAGAASGCRWNRRRHYAAMHAQARTEDAPNADEQQHAAAMAAVAAEPMQQPTIAYTAVMPVAQTGVTWGFGPRGVVDAAAVEWTPAVSATAGRHAGRAA